ncbi:hypothetical protein PFISCL1PPCAC_18854 [Pristionchus fissidentatus]|uniref:RING-type domain-containing protein n=1 Tax=Pristionchus fissidentatus TaxID=1538716 RepID=A0AAV5W984_9BILA|nr:hypothetical protein PFISCL1PPCAC_18854 [Pristionchus fissidentatus]
MPAAHIQKLATFLLKVGIKCDICSIRREKEIRKIWIGTKNEKRAVSVTYPRELMQTYYDRSNGTSVYRIPHIFHADLDTPKTRKKKDSKRQKWAEKHNEITDDKEMTILCGSCSLEVDSEKDDKFWKLSGYEDWHSSVPQKLKFKVHVLIGKAEKYGLKDEKITVADVKARIPPHLYTLSAVDMSEFVDEMLVCRCKLPYTFGNLPKMLACGHLCCKSCEDEICATRSGKCFLMDTNECNGPLHVNIQRSTPQDLILLLSLRESAFRQCRQCHKLHAIEYFTDRTMETCIYCVMMCLPRPASESEPRGEQIVTPIGTICNPTEFDPI